jgi:hypothetical protein
MRLFILKYGNQTDEKELKDLFKNNYKVVFATPMKDCIYYILS